MLSTLLSFLCRDVKRWLRLRASFLIWSMFFWFQRKNLAFSGLFAGEVNAHLNIDNFVIADAGDDRVVNNEVGIGGEEEV